MPKKIKPPRIIISFTERQLYLLADGFNTSFQRDDDDPGCRELGKISDKLSRAELRLYHKSDDREPVGYMRDLDGTGSYHVCSKGDPGSFPVYR